MRINVTPKDGGNRFSGSFFARARQEICRRRTDRRKSKRFLPLRQASTTSISSTRASAGRSSAIRSGSTCRAGARLPAFAPGAMLRRWNESGHQADAGQYSFITRLTWQATQANKFRLYLDRQYNGEDYNNVSATISPEASQQAFGGGWTPQVKWTSTPTNRLLIDAGITLYDLPYEVAYQDGRAARSTQLEQTTLALTVATTNRTPAGPRTGGRPRRCPT